MRWQLGASAPVPFQLGPLQPVYEAAGPFLIPVVLFVLGVGLYAVMALLARLDHR